MSRRAQHNVDVAVNDVDAGVRPKTIGRIGANPEVAARFRRACELAGFTYAQIARHMKVTENAIIPIATGARPLTVDKLEAMPMAVRREYVSLLSDSVADDFDGDAAGALAVDAFVSQVTRMARDANDFAAQSLDATADRVLTETERKALVKAGVAASKGIRTTLLRLVGRTS